jgi:hypothetical protein
MSTFKDWTAFRTWYGEAVQGFTDPDAQVRELAAKLTRGKATRDAKLRALFDFVADDIRYVNYVSGEWWLPNRPQQLLARREGDCDDKALLLITLLKAAGIEAQEVMVQTRMTNQPGVVRAQGAAIPLFDHGIAFLPGPGGGTYLDATSPQSRLGPLPSMDARAVAAPPRSSSFRRAPPTITASTRRGRYGWRPTEAPISRATSTERATTRSSCAPTSPSRARGRSGSRIASSAPGSRPSRSTRRSTSRAICRAARPR